MEGFAHVPAMTNAEKLLALIHSNTLTYTQAAARLGVSRRTVYNWLIGKHKIPEAVMVAAPKMLKTAKKIPT